MSSLTSKKERWTTGQNSTATFSVSPSSSASTTKTSALSTPPFAPRSCVTPPGRSSSRSTSRPQERKNRRYKNTWTISKEPGSNTSPSPQRTSWPLSQDWQSGASNSSAHPTATTQSFLSASEESRRG